MNPPTDTSIFEGQGWWLYVVAAVSATGLLLTFSENLRKSLGPAGKWLSQRKERNIQRSLREQMAQDALDEVRVADLRKQVTFLRDELGFVRDELASAKEESRQSREEARVAQDEARAAQRAAVEAERVHSSEMRTLQAQLTEALSRLTQLTADVKEVKNGQNNSN